MNNTLSNQPERPKFSVAIQSKGYQALINSTLKDPKRAQRFVASITSAVATNPALQECNPATILSGALLGESLNLSPSPQLGQYYLVPFDNKKMGCKDAQFLLGYKGLVQLALRSGYYKRLNVMSVKAGELVRFDPLTEEIDLNIIQDENEREQAATIGYVAMFEYLNGFSKTIYWSREKMINHADRYSPAFSKNATTGRYPKVSFEDYCAGNYPTSDAWKYSSFWYKDFDGMAYKTMLRQLISKWGVMSIDLQTAFESDTVEQEAPDYIQTDTQVQLPQKEVPVLDGPEEPERSETQVSLSDA
jgi:recombination protein RecT